MRVSSRRCCSPCRGAFCCCFSCRMGRAASQRRGGLRSAAGTAGATVHSARHQPPRVVGGAPIRGLAATRPPMAEPGRLHRIPVVYEGPDLEEVAARLNLSPLRIVELHTGPIYRVFLVGFVPGWAYLGPLPEELELPRRHVPRTQVPAGVVALAGRQTGISRAA